MKRKIILASTSPRRKELLSGTGLEFEIIAGNYEEDMTLPVPPQDLVTHLSRGKAESVSSPDRNAIIIAADTIVALGNLVLGKPHAKEKAKEMLCKLSSSTHQVITGFTIKDEKSNKIISRAVVSHVVFRRLEDLEIDEYVETGEPLDKAGAYAIQGLAQKFIERIEGDESNIVGLPVQALLEELEKFGIRAETGQLSTTKVRPL
jgi:septum formation protein